MLNKLAYHLMLLGYQYTYRWYLLITKRPNKRYITAWLKQPAGGLNVPHPPHH